MQQLLLERLETGTVLDGLSVEVDGDEDGLRLVSPREHDGLAEEAYLGDDLGHVRADVGDAHLSNSGLAHAPSIHKSPFVMSVARVALYNSGVNGAPADRSTPPP